MLAKKSTEREYYRLPLNSKLEELNILRAKKLQILLWVRLRTQISAPNPKKNHNKRHILIKANKPIYYVLFSCQEIHDSPFRK